MMIFNSLNEKQIYMRESQMVDKYEALQNTTNWIVNSSPEEFLSTFNQLEGDYDGITLGEYIDSSLDDSVELDDYNI